jgi:hypothetical protein
MSAVRIDFPKNLLSVGYDQGLGRLTLAASSSPSFFSDQSGCCAWYHASASSTHQPGIFARAPLFAFGIFGLGLRGLGTPDGNVRCMFSQ